MRRTQAHERWHEYHLLRGIGLGRQLFYVWGSGE